MGFVPRSNGANRARRRPPQVNINDIRGAGGRKTTRTFPPEQTNAESFYYQKQMNARTPMVVITTDGEEIRGCIEWYDRECLKINRTGAPNVVIQKHCIKYVFKDEDASVND